MTILFLQWESLYMERFFPIGTEPVPNYVVKHH